MILAGNWYYPTSVRFGAGRISELAASCQDCNIHRPLLVTDSGLADLPMIAKALEHCRQAHLAVELFSDVSGNPDGEQVNAGVDAFLAGDHDGVIAIGGGSALDAGKAIALIARQNRPLWDFEDIGDNWRRADSSAIAGVIAVPTTAGTGSEVGRASVITDRDAKIKRLIFHPNMLPKQVIADPELTTGLPAALTAATGMDALSHNMEAFFAPNFHPMARGIAIEGMRLVQTSLAAAVADGSNIDARANMLAASMAGATAFQKGLGGMHALAHPLGALFNAHHGMLNAVLMPYVLLANQAAIDKDAAWLAQALALGNKFSDLLNWVLALRQQVGIPHSLAEIGIDESAAKQVGEMAVQDPSAGGNPIEFNATQYAAIFTDACRGELAI